MSETVKSLAGQTVLVTGASGDIGAAIVEKLAVEGARAVIHYGRDRAAAEALPPLSSPDPSERSA